MLLGLLPADLGLGHACSTSTSPPTGPAIRERVGYMPEHDCLPPDVSATEFVVHMARMSGLPTTAARERTADTLRHVGLYEERYRPIGGYSTGMKQRVKLAQALVHDPQLVLLDEPTNGLDPAGRDDMLGLIRRIGTEFGISVLVTSHLLGELERVCDHVVVIDGGRLLRSSSTADVTAASQLIAVEVTERTDELAAALREAGLGARPVGALLEVDLQDDTTYDIVRDAVAAPRRRPDPDGTPPAPDVRDLHHARREPLMSATTGQGVIHDIGYRHYDGPRAGRGYIARALFLESAKGAYGLGRSAKSKVMPMLLLAAICLPAFIIVVIATVTNDDELPGDYTSYVLNVQPARHGLRRRPGTRERLARPALPGRVAVLLAAAGAHRLRRWPSTPR